MGPIASKILADLRKKQRGVIDLGAVREARAREAALDALPELEAGELPPAHAFWMRAFADLSGFGYSLLQSRHLRKLAERVQESEERYMPGGPPVSPLTDSFHSCWCLCDATIGPKKETVAMIAGDVARIVGGPQRMLDAWSALASSYPGVYRILEHRDYWATLEELVTGEVRRVELADELPGGPGDLWLTRLLPPPPGNGHDLAWTSFTTPYLLGGGDPHRAWSAYFERVLAKTPPDRHAQQYRRHMKHGSTPFTWFEFISEGYAGAHGHAVVLAGVPDRAETLPHSPDRFTPAAGASSLERVRLRLQERVQTTNLGPQAADEFATAREDIGGLEPAPMSQWNEFEHILLAAHAMYGTRGVSGQTALELVASDDSEDMPADERAELEALQAGWFSVFEVVRIKLDEAIEVRDILKRRRFWLAEKSGTRGLCLGDLLAGWIMEDGDRRALEGANLRIPQMFSDSIASTVRALMDQLRADVSGTWRQRHTMLPPVVSALAARLFQDPPPMRLTNHDGDELLLSEARYRVADPSAVRRTLDAAAELQAVEDGYDWIEGDVLVARMELTHGEVRVHTNSRPRHARMRAWIDQHLGTFVEHRGDSFSDPSSKAFRDSDANEPLSDEPPPEIGAAIAALLQERLHAWLDTEIPALRGRTPRQAVRSARGRDDVAAMLLEQERILRTNPGADQLDFAALWTELGLVHPGPSN